MKPLEVPCFYGWYFLRTARIPFSSAKAPPPVFRPVSFMPSLELQDDGRIDTDIIEVEIDDNVNNECCKRWGEVGLEKDVDPGDWSVDDEGNELLSQERWIFAVRR